MPICGACPRKLQAGIRLRPSSLRRTDLRLTPQGLPALHLDISEQPANKGLSINEAIQFLGHARIQ